MYVSVCMNSSSAYNHDAIEHKIRNNISHRDCKRTYVNSIRPMIDLKQYERNFEFYTCNRNY